ncbi:MAG: hypothetical protein OEW75_09120, partial [Cyclobacteriaceae bacterium]|nr:hypothetical protein [Cyclobacteriaceae bacterium]
MNFLKNKILLSGFIALFSLMVSAQTVNYVNGALNVDVFVSNACDGLDNGYLEFTLNSAIGNQATLSFVEGPDPIFFQFVNATLDVGVPYRFDYNGIGLFASSYDFIIVNGPLSINTYSAAHPSPTLVAYNAIVISEDSKTDNTSCITPDGAITVSLTEGSGSYSYNWTGTAGYSSNGVNTTGTPISIVGLEGGTYTLTVDDDFSVCSATIDVVLTNPTVTIVSDVVTPNDRCIAPYSGVISITASGAGGTYSYSWSGPNGYTSSNEDITNLEAGNYTVDVTDITSGCVNSLLIPVTLNTPIIGVTLDSDVGNSSCTSPNGSLAITPTGGTTYSYLWTGPNGFTSA